MIYYIIGIRRSGLHAIANWLFPMMGEFIYLNNYELGKLTEFEMVVKGNFNVIIGLENKPIDEVLKYTQNGKRIWVWRELDSIIASQKRWYITNEIDGTVIEMKLMTAKQLYEDYWFDSRINGEFIIYYDAWESLDKYREATAERLGLQFNDSNKEKIFGYGKSSFV